MIDIAMSFTPMLSFVAASHFICLMHYSLIKELSIEVTAKQIVNIAQTHAFISNIVNKTAAEALAIA